MERDMDPKDFSPPPEVLSLGLLTTAVVEKEASCFSCVGDCSVAFGGGYTHSSAQAFMA